MKEIKTLREANRIAKELGLVRGKGSYNGLPYWKNAAGQIVTRHRLAEMADFVQFAIEYSIVKTTSELKDGTT